jgi:cbb3-type cytochrome c oxidase subunit III
MRAHHSFTLTGVVATALWMAAVGAHARVVAQSAGAKMQNPVPSDAASIAAGKKLYDNNCTECHGEAGKGDGPRAPYSNPTPPNLSDTEWKHGSSDGEIFTVIQNGVNDTDMPSFQKDLQPPQIWQIVNYVKSLGAKK